MDNVREFIEHVKVKCRAAGIKLKFKKVKYLVLSKKIKCSGYFDETGKELVIATNNLQWLEVLAHEYGHLTQWEDNCEEWKNLGDSLDKIDRWLAGEQVGGIKKALARARDLELDNEKRTVKIIKEWKLPVNVEEYIQKANAYVSFYNWIYYTRRWCSPKNSPIGNVKVYGQMPKSFRMDYTVLSKEHKKLFKEARI